MKIQQVSRLLAAIYVLSASSEPFSLPPSSCKALSECHWASYFHHASLGTHLNHQFFSNMAGKLKAQNLLNVEVSMHTNLLGYSLAVLVRVDLTSNSSMC